MTDAPKIDTQAPDDRALWHEIISNAPDRVSILWGDLTNRYQDFDDDTARVTHLGQFVFGTEYIRADIADARAAAAYRQGLHDGITKAANRYWVGSQPDNWDYFRVAHNAMLDLKSFEFPAPEGQAALDRLIAERVREAVEAEREACRQIVQSVINDPRTKFWGDLAEARERIALRGSKEGRDG